MFHPSWDSIGEIEGHLAAMLVVAWFAMLLAAGATVWYQRHTNKYEARLALLEKQEATRISADEATKATERANKLQGTVDDLSTKLATANQSIADLVRSSGEISKQTKDISAKVTNRVTMLTPDVRAKLIARLNKLPAGSVGCTSLNLTPESTDFGGAIREILSRAGCLGGGEINISAGSFSGAPTTGVIVNGFGPEGQPVADELIAAFKEAGIPDIIRGGNVVFFKTGSHAQVTIGSR